MSSFTAENNQVPEMQQNLKLLQEVSLFANFPAKAQKLLAFLAERAQISPDDILFEEGDDNGRAYLILDGQLTLLKHHDKKDIIIQHYTRGDFVGFLSLLGAMPALFTLRATTKTTVLIISRNHFSKILEQFPATTNISLKALLEVLHEWERKNIHEAAQCCLGKTGVTAL